MYLQYISDQCEVDIPTDEFWREDYHICLKLLEFFAENPRWNLWMDDSSSDRSHELMTLVQSFSLFKKLLESSPRRIFVFDANFLFDMSGKMETVIHTFFHDDDVFIVPFTTVEEVKDFPHDAVI